MEGVYYTRHAKSRMHWRGITKEEVTRVLTEPEAKELIGENRYYYFKRVGTMYLRVTCVFEENTCIIISVVDKND